MGWRKDGRRDSTRYPLTTLGLRREILRLRERLETERAERHQLEVIYKRLREQIKHGPVRSS